MEVGSRVYKTGIGHGEGGKRSVTAELLVADTHGLVDSSVTAKPAAAKGKDPKGVTLASTMGPGIRIDTAHTDVAKHSCQSHAHKNRKS